jgi:hypothetical protein
MVFGHGKVPRTSELLFHDLVFMTILAWPLIIDWYLVNRSSKTLKLSPSVDGLSGEIAEYSTTITHRVGND